MPVMFEVSYMPSEGVYASVFKYAEGVKAGWDACESWCVGVTEVGGGMCSCCGVMCADMATGCVEMGCWS